MFIIWQQVKIARILLQDFLISCVCSRNFFLASSFDRAHGTYVRFSVRTFICTVIWCFSIIQSKWLFDQSTCTRYNPHKNTAWTKQIEHCHSVAKHSLRLHTHHKIYSCSAPTFQCNGKRQEREGISFIIIKIDVGHLMGKLLFHGEIANRTHQVKGKGRAITLTR